jgi:hypothetical protein
MARPIATSATVAASRANIRNPVAAAIAIPSVPSRDFSRTAAGRNAR